MKISRMCALILLVAIGSGMAFADGITDPKIVIHNVNGSAPEGQGVGVGVNFTFSVPKSGTGTLFFTNDSGKAWTWLALIETGEPAADISCALCRCCRRLRIGCGYGE